MKKKKFGFGIIGTGVISQFHAKAIAEVENARLVGVYDHVKEKAESFCQSYGGKVYNTLESLLHDPDIEIVSICTPSGMHLEPTVKCIKAGKHCLVEKPLEVTVERCDQIINESKIAGVKVAVIFPSRFYEVNKQLKQSIDDNRFGNLVLGSAYVKWSRSEEYYKSAGWRATWKYDGGGALMNQGIHSVDLLQWMMGPVESLQAVTANRRHKQIEVEDTVVATLKFSNGALGTIECTTAAFPGFFKRLEIVGTSGSAIIEENSVVKWQFQNEIAADDIFRTQNNEVKNSAGGVSDPTSISYYGHKIQIEDFITSIEKNTTPLIDAVEGRKSVEIVSAVYQSAKTNEKVFLSNT